MRQGTFKYLRQFVFIGQKIVLPGFEGVPLYRVLLNFFKALYDGALTARASAMAFSFFLALFPGIIFIFSLIPFLPIENVDGFILEQLEALLPKSAFELSKETIIDLANNQRGSLLSFGFLMMLLFTSNGINTMLEMFNHSVHTKEKRSFLNQWLVAIVLMLILLLLLIFSSILIVFYQVIVDYTIDLIKLKDEWVISLIELGRWLITFAFVYFSISFIYFLGPIGRTKWKFFSLGSTVATLLVILFSLGFAFYVNHFGTYNKFYGSIGTLMVIMLWIYFNSLVLLFGFELNASLARTKRRKIRNYLKA